jgi:hypothetical protein
MTDIVERLRNLGDHAAFDPAMHHVAANYIVELRAEIQQLTADCIVELKDEIQQLKKQTNSVYTERNRLVSFIASMFPSGIKETDIPGWDKEWHGCVYIDLPNGQASWHYHESEAHMFAHLLRYEGEWDGHTTEEKYNRVAALELRHIMEKIND